MNFNGRTSEEASVKLAIAVFGGPDTDSPGNAAKFARAALAQGHEVLSLFFYHEAVCLAWSADAEESIEEYFSPLRSLGVPLQVCVGASERRGFRESTGGIHPVFELVGLGQLISAILAADRVVTFSG